MDGFPPFLTPEMLRSLPIMGKTIDGEVLKFRSYCAGFLNEWRKAGVAYAATEELALKASSFFLFEQFHATDWRKNSLLVFPKGYRYLGLESLSALFGEVTRRYLKTEARGKFKSSMSVLPEGNCSDDQKICFYEDWEKAFWLSAFKFRWLEHGDPVSDRIIGDLFCRYGLKPADTFLLDFHKLKNEPDRWQNLEFLKRIAMAWDIFVLPLRFFADEAAMNFAQEELEFRGTDLGNFRKLIRNAGGNRQHGLRLKPESPSIIKKWSPTITFIKRAAEEHGFPVDQSINLLRNFSKRRVHVI